MPEVRDDAKVIEQLFEYLTERKNPYRANYLETIKKCYEFKELNQWGGVDTAALEMWGVPPIAVDRINRGLDTIDGIRENTDLRKRILKSQLGDEAVAVLLDKVYEHFDTEFQEPREDAFLGMLDTGLGVRKVGFDFGKRSLWSEFVNTEDFYWSKCKSKRLLDATWFVQKQTMNWEDAALINPKLIKEVFALKTSIQSEWEKLNATTTKPVTSANSDYGGASGESSTMPHPDQVELLEFWIKRITPFVKVAYSEMVPTDIGGVSVPMPRPQVRKEGVDYEVQEGEQIIGDPDIDESWEQFIIATGGSKAGALILQQGTAKDHPFVATCAQRKKSGEPRGYIEIAIPHQVRINLAWAQKVAYNNKSIKSPLVLQGNTTPDLVDTAIKQSSIGAVFVLPLGVSASFNTQLQLNTQAIEEGNQAREDMDFAAAATEPSMRGQAPAADSGIKTSILQNAAITPLNKWVKAFEKSEYDFSKKVLKLIIENMKPVEMVRIVGEQVWGGLGLQIMGDAQNGGTIVLPNGQPLDLSILDYDVKMENQAVSDFNKQQSFNAIASLQAMKPTGMFTDDFLIKSAPIKDVDSALESNAKHNQDVILQLLQQMQMMQEEMGQLQKQIPKGTNQTGNARTGKNAPQAGRQSMMGGTSPKSPVGMKA